MGGASWPGFRELCQMSITIAKRLWIMIAIAAAALLVVGGAGLHAIGCLSDSLDVATHNSISR